MSPSPAVLFVCLGNICRSPMAEAAFRLEAQTRGVTVSADSAGTGAWHVGEPPDRRARSVAYRHGCDIDRYAARQVTPEDFFRFDEIVALDRQNLRDLAGLAPRDASARLSLLLDHVAGREGTNVADPYYGTIKDFERVWEEVTLGARGLLDAIVARDP